jgi:hypothetical protein
MLLELTEEMRGTCERLVKIAREAGEEDNGILDNGL